MMKQEADSRERQVKRLLVDNAALLMTLRGLASPDTDIRDARRIAQETIRAIEQRERAA